MNAQLCIIVITKIYYYRHLIVLMNRYVDHTCM